MATTLTPSSSFTFFNPIKTPKTFQSTTPFLTLKKTPISITCFQSPETTIPLPPKVQTFWGWLSDKGIITPKTPLKPAIVPEGLGLLAQKNLSRNEVVMEMPKKFWISPETVSASEIGSLCDGLKPWVTVALFLMRERKLGDASSWKPYIDILPECTDSTIYWSEEELSELQGSQLLSTTLGVKDLVANEFTKLEEEVIVPNKRLFPFDITLNDFFWAFGILRSRAFTRLEGQSLVLIPLADMINHSPAITAQDYAWEVRGAGLFSRELLFSLKTPAPVKAGDQVLIQYDLNKSNAELALDYGFIESGSDRNAYTLTLEIPESDPFFGDKLDIAESNGMGEVAYFDIVLDQPLPATMLPYLRLLALGGGDAFLLESIFSNSIWGHLELPISRANEEHICQVIRNACTTAISGYSTTIEEDEKMLAESDLNPRLKIAIGVRLGEKKVLQQIDEVFEKREMEVGGFEYYQERRLKDLGLAGAQGEKLPWIGEV